jgi:hypothetical protein
MRIGNGKIQSEGVKKDSLEKEGNEYGKRLQKDFYPSVTEGVVEMYSRLTSKRWRSILLDSQT